MLLGKQVEHHRLPEGLRQEGSLHCRGWGLTVQGRPVLKSRLHAAWERALAPEAQHTLRGCLAAGSEGPRQQQGVGWGSGECSFPGWCYWP